jgi:hypothetical protein
MRYCHRLGYDCWFIWYPSEEVIFTAQGWNVTLQVDYFCFAHSLVFSEDVWSAFLYLSLDITVDTLSFFTFRFQFDR